MKILDLLEGPIDTTIEPVKQYSGRLKPKFGRGSAFSTVNAVKDDPHMIKKHGHRPLSYTEGFRLFAEYLLENKIENPHFPRIYVMGKIKDAHGQAIDTYTIEKLIPLSQLSLEELSGMWETHCSEPREWHTTYLAKDALTSIFLDVVYSPGHADWLKLETLQEAAAIIRHFFSDLKKRNIRFGEDLHSENYMARRTQHGLQLVITDPIYSGSL